MHKFLIASLLLAATGASATSQLTPDQVRAKLEAKGYKDVSSIQRAYDHYDVVATKAGKKVAVDVDPQTGDITPDKDGQTPDPREHLEKKPR